MLKRLIEIREANQSAGLEMLIEESNLKIGRPEVVTSFNLFQTPKFLAQKMRSLAITKDKTILEPSVGLGRLIEGINDAKSIACIDINNKCLEQVYRRFNSVVIKQGDFLAMDFKTKFDLILMNPPFENKLDIKHILKAKNLSKQVVFLCMAGHKREELLKPLCDYWELIQSPFENTKVSCFLGKIKNKN